MLETKSIPKCRYCGRSFNVGDQWHGANYCRAAFLVEFVADHPGLTTWEISQESGVAYSVTSKGLTKARDHGLVEFTPEERDAGGVRYRYRAAPQWPGIVGGWQAQGLI